MYREPARLCLPKEAAVQVRHSTLESGAVKSAALHARPADAKNVHLHFRYVLRSHLRLNGVLKHVDFLRDLPRLRFQLPQTGIPLSSGLSCSWLLLLSVVLRYRPEGLAPDARGGARTFGRTGYAAPPRQSAKRHVSGSLTNRCLPGTYRGGFLWEPSNRRALTRVREPGRLRCYIPPI